MVGPELAELDRIGNELRTLLAATPTVTYTMAQLEMGAPVARVMADEASTELAGLRLGDLANQLRSDLDGVVDPVCLFQGQLASPVRLASVESTPFIDACHFA